MKLAILCVFVFILSLGKADAQSSTEPAAFKPTQHPTLDIHRRHGDINIDGDLSDAGWRDAAHVEEFSTALPIAYQKPSERTEGFITYDDDYLYIAMIAHDSDPSAIRATHCGRDNMFKDDFMGIILDTYGDASRAFEIYTNPFGVQGDLFWSANNEDDSYDLVYQSEAKITTEGWQMEMRIPFKSLRFPDKPVQSFHGTFWRHHPRDNAYRYTWAPMNFYDPCAFCQLGTFTGIENIHASGNLELLPALVIHQSAALDASGNGLVNDPVKLEPSLGLRYSLGSSTSLEAAIKPDFSQVEADASQVDVNSTFALYYPERRPFFQDGSDVFNTLLTAVYTRSINAPSGVAKGIYRDATNTISYIGAIDDHSPLIVPLEERSYITDVGKSVSNIFRAMHSFSDDTYLGLLATDRRYTSNGSNTVLSLDGKIHIIENIEFAAQSLFSHTKEQTDSMLGGTTTFDDGKHTVKFDGEDYWGFANYLSLSRFTRTLDVQSNFMQLSPTFRAGNGFITSTSYQQSATFIGYKALFDAPPSYLRWITELDGSITFARTWNFDGTTKLSAMRPEIDLSLIGQTTLHLFYRLSEEEYRGIRFMGLHYWDFKGDSRFSHEVVIGGELTIGRTIARNLAVPTTGKELDISAYAEIRPFARIIIEPNYTYSKLANDSGGNFYEGSIYHARLTYQFTRALDLRVVVEYNTFSDRLIIDPLLTYKLNPFTIFYIGSAHGFTSPQPGLLPSDAQTQWQATDRQFFAKFQYLFST
jgi:hypothetical protein